MALVAPTASIVEKYLVSEALDGVVVANKVRNAKGFADLKSGIKA